MLNILALACFNFYSHHTCNPHRLSKKKESRWLVISIQKKAIPAIMIYTNGNSCHVSKKQSDPLLISKKLVGSSSTAPGLTSSANPLRKHDSSPFSPVQSSPRTVKNNTSTCPTLSVQQKGPSIYLLYTPDTAIVGPGSNNVAQNSEVNVSSSFTSVDAEFINSLGWSDLVHQTCSSLTEGIMYQGELVERADLLKSSYQDLRENSTSHDQVQLMLEKVKMANARDLKESKAQFDELLKKNEELHQLQEKHTTKIYNLKGGIEAFSIRGSTVMQGSQRCQDAIYEGIVFF